MYIRKQTGQLSGKILFSNKHEKFLIQKYLLLKTFIDKSDHKNK